MSPKLSRYAAALAPLLVACAGRLPPEGRPPLAIVTAVPYAADSGVTPDLRDCGLEEELLETLENDTEDYFRVALVADARGVPGRALVMRFARIEGNWGGAMTGGKSLTVTGNLLDSGHDVAGFTARWETSVMHAQIGKQYRTTCDLLELAAEELAEDIAEWLRVPTPGARLGDL